MMRPLFLSALIAAGLACQAPAAEGDMGLAKVLELAKRGPEALASKGQADKQAAAADAHWRAAFMPKLVATGAFTHYDRELEAQIYPLGTIKLGDQNVWGGGAVALVPILDVEQMVYGVRTADRAAEATALAADQAARDNQSKAVGYYLQALELRAKRKALEEYAANLSARSNEIRRLYELGGVGESDLMKVRLGVEDARQGVREYQEKEALLAAMLAQSVGGDRPVVPADLPDDLPQAKAVAGSPADRCDLKALDLQMQAVEAARAGAEASFLPKVNATGSYLRADQKMLNQQEVCMVGGAVTWTVFDGAIGHAKAKAADAELASLREKRRAAVMALKAQQDDSLAMLDIKRREFAERRKAVEDAQTASALEFKRLRQGKVTVNNYIDAEDLLKDRKEKMALSRIAWWQEWFKLQAAGGLELGVPK